MDGASASLGLTAARALACAMGVLVLSACAETTTAQPDRHVTTTQISIGVSLFADQPDKQWRLPNPLREVSGLAATLDGRVMGHNDEAAVVFEIDILTGDIVKRFSLGEPAIRDDFEGLAVTARGDFYLTTSTGRIYRFREGRARESVPYEVFDSGLRNVCEIEGLAVLAAEQSLILACKDLYAPAMRNSVALYQWSMRDPGRTPARPWLTLEKAPLAEAIGARDFHPSSVEIDPGTGRVIVLAARQNGIVELSAQGEILAARQLGARHRQPEGSTILDSGALLIADEGEGEARGTLTRYPRRS